MRLESWLTIGAEVLCGCVSSRVVTSNILFGVAWAAYRLDRDLRGLRSRDQMLNTCRVPLNEIHNEPGRVDLEIEV